jgi:hypothetical protein
MRGLFLMVGVSLLLAQKIVSRMEIEAEGYAVEKVGLPQSPAAAGPNRVAFVEYFVQGKLKPKTGYYLECLDTDYNEVWSVLLDIPPAGEGRPIRLLPMARALVVLSYEADPLQKGVIQEVGRFYNLKGQPILPKWTALSIYDRPTSAEGQYALSPDSTYFLWYAQEVDKKGQVRRTWFAIWSENGRKVASESEWAVGGQILAAQPDNKARVWALVLPSGQRVPQLQLYDPRARATRIWEFSGDTVWVLPALRLTSKGVWVAALLPDTANRPTEEGPPAPGASLIYLRISQTPLSLSSVRPPSPRISSNSPKTLFARSWWAFGRPRTPPPTSFGRIGASKAPPPSPTKYGLPDGTSPPIA